ncbi:MAG: hypothetical protein RLZZ67_266 [Candidatus Parcubacteria bacterium]|jgi:hypothetical protein
MSTKNLVSAVIILFFCLSSLIYKESEDQGYPQDPLQKLWVGNYVKEKDALRASIKKLGAEEAYEIFKKDTADKEFDVAHTLAHIMGELLYESEGEKGITVCDGAFAFGCYHSFFGKAIATEGLDSITRLAEACYKRWGLGLGCPHGIGHGILGYFGDEKLVEALGVCDKLVWKEKFGGCQSGVFMEYNFHTMQSVVSAENRKFDPQRPYEPCTDIPTKNRETCYFEQPQWWLRIFKNDFARAADFCASIVGAKEKEACYLGTGNVAAPSSEYDVLKTQQSCAYIKEKAGEVSCLQRAAWAFFAELKARNDSIKVCDKLSGKDIKECPSQKDISDRVNKL